MRHVTISASAIFALTISVLTPALCHADQLAPPTPQIYGSEYGDRALRVVPDKEGLGGKSTGTWFKVDNRGRLVPGSTFKMLGCPRTVLIPQTPDFFVALDTMGRVGFEHALVIYRCNKVVRELKVEDLLTRREIIEHVPHTVSSRWWHDEARFSFDTPNKWASLTPQSAMVTPMPERTTLRITFPWGKKVVVMLATGKVVRPPSAGQKSKKAPAGRPTVKRKTTGLSRSH